MKIREFYFFSIVVLCLAFGQSRSLAQSPTPTPEAIVVVNSSEISPADADRIHFGDLIDVDVIGSVEYDWRGTVTPEGFLNGVDYAENPIYALCRREEEIAADVAQASAKILRAPQVVVKILDRSNRPLALLYGAIKTPQRFQIKRSFYLNELIIVAGGLTDRASGEIQVFRQKNLSCRQPLNEISGAIGDSSEKKENFVKASQDNGSNYINIRISDLLSGKKEANPQIFSGDVVTVLEAESIYVIGGVANPKQISSRSQTSLSRAVAAAGGIVKSADQRKIVIYRRTGSETQIIEADLEKIKAGESEDLALKAFDIVEVEQTKGGKRKFPPVLKVAEADGRKTVNLPLRVID